MMFFTGLAFIAYWNDPANSDAESYIFLGCAIFFFGLMFALCPRFAYRLKIVPGEHGRRHFLCCYQLSFLVAIFAIVCVAVGHYFSNANGSVILDPNVTHTLTIADVDPVANQGMHFAVTNG